MEAPLDSPRAPIMLWNVLGSVGRGAVDPAITPVSATFVLVTN